MYGIKKRTWVIGAVVAAIIGTGAIASRYHNSSMEDRADFASYMISKKLELDDTQESALDRLVENWVSSAGTMKDFRKSMLEEVKTLATGENLTIEQIYVLRDKIKAEIDNKTDALAPQFVAFYNGLEPAQKEKVIARLDKMSEHMGKDGHHRRHEGRRHNFWHGSD